MVRPAVSERTQAVASYVLPRVLPTQFGASFSSQVALVVPPFQRRADAEPERPPLTAARVTPEPLRALFQPDVSLSNPGLPTRFCLTSRLAVRLPESPDVL